MGYTVHTVFKLVLKTSFHVSTYKFITAILIAVWYFIDI